MNRRRLVFALGMSLLIFCGCAATIKPPDWTFEKEAIRVHVKASPKLNLYNSKAHTLYVCFYQLSALNGFDQLTQDEAGIRKLLEGRLFDVSVASVSSKVIHSSENLTFILDRAEKAQYLAVVTGYSAKLDNARMVRRHKIRVLKKRERFWKNEYRCVPCTMEIELALGPNQIEYSKRIENEKACRDECQ